MPTIAKFLEEEHKYDVDFNYQRPADAWSKEDKQCFIDTILRGEPIPIFFINEQTSTGKSFIVDGQQRLGVIKEFRKGDLTLNKKFSGKDLHGATYKTLNDDLRDKFLSYSLSFKIMEDYDDERVRLIFSRLQRGKPLQLGERLNAMPGKIVTVMREIAKMPFMECSIAVPQNRYGAYPDSVRILFYEMFGPKQCGSEQLYDFMDKHKDIDFNNSAFKKVKTNLNFLRQCFPEDNYHYLEKHAWVLTVYSMISELKKYYSLIGREEEIRNFVQAFHGKVYSEDHRNSTPSYQKFYDNVRGGWSEKIIAIRKKIILEEFHKKVKLEELDDKRQISDEEKIAIFSNNPNCTACGYKFKDHKEPEYHHIKRFADGGKTELNNIMVLCASCHDKAHGKEQIVMPSESDYTEED